MTPELELGQMLHSGPQAYKSRRFAFRWVDLFSNPKVERANTRVFRGVNLRACRLFDFDHNGLLDEQK
jgi:hypothetical protein